MSFLTKKAIDGTCGEVLECRKIRSGQIVIKTKNSTEASKLSTLIALSDTITIDIKPHNFLNTSKGVIYSNELRGIPESEILEELKAQSIIEIKKILKKTDHTLVETGLIVLTFQSSNLPTKINIGYSKVEVRPYIPPPMRCSNCFKYNHTAKFCVNLKSCFNCGIHHTDDDTNICFRPNKCSNCLEQNIIPANHTAADKKCPIFMKEQELQAIKTTYRTDNKTAKQMYKERHQHDINTYSAITRHPVTTSTPNTPLSTTQRPIPSTTPRKIIT